MSENNFLSEYLLLSKLQTWIFLFILLLLFLIIYRLDRKKVKFSKRMFTGMILGLLLGIIIQFIASFPTVPKDITWIKELSIWYGLIGNGFMDLLKMITVPLVLFSITRVIMNTQGNELGKITSRSIGMFLTTTLTAALIGIIIASIFGLGKDLSVPLDEAIIREITTLPDTLRSLLPSNPIQAMAEGDIIAIVIFASFIGVAIKRLKIKYLEVVNPFILFVEASYKIVLSIIMTILKLMPYALIPMLSNTIMSYGMEMLYSVIKFILAIYIGIISMFIVHLVIALFNGISPKNYIKKAFEPLLLAFTSRSSLGTLPVTTKTLHQEFGLNEGVASFVGSLGANMGMNGCAGIYPAIVTVMLAQVSGVPLSIDFYITLTIIIAISSFGIAGIPGSATIAISVVVSAMGMESLFPLLGGIIAIDPILDMGRTMLNVNGTMITAITVSKSLKKDTKG